MKSLCLRLLLVTTLALAGSACRKKSEEKLAPAQIEAPGAKAGKKDKKSKPKKDGSKKEKKPKDITVPAEPPATPAP